jgi:hypothetical protein
VKIEEFEKEIHFSGEKLLIESQHMHILYVWWSLSTAGLHLGKQI